MVGTTGFEPATSRTPSVRATRLRYVPTDCGTTFCCSPPMKVRSFWPNCKKSPASKDAGYNTVSVSLGFEDRQ
jgi:hypothetical protein